MAHHSRVTNFKSLFQCMESNTFSAPYHSATNGQAEKVVQKLKQDNCEISHGTMEEN